MTGQGQTLRALLHLAANTVHPDPEVGLERIRARIKAAAASGVEPGAAAYADGCKDSKEPNDMNHIISHPPDPAGRPSAARLVPPPGALVIFAEHGQRLADEAATLRKAADGETAAADEIQARINADGERVRELLAQVERIRDAMATVQDKADGHRRRAQKFIADAAERIETVEYMRAELARAERLPEFAPACCCGLPDAPDAAEARAACPVHRAAALCGALVGSRVTVRTTGGQECAGVLISTDEERLTLRTGADMTAHFPVDGVAAVEPLIDDRPDEQAPEAPGVVVAESGPNRTQPDPASASSSGQHERPTSRLEQLGLRRRDKHAPVSDDTPRETDR